MKSVVLLLLAAIGSLQALPSDPHCAWGESYWCSSLRAAKTCGAVDHCASTVWRNQILVQDGSEMCQFCELIVGDVQNYIKEKKTQEEISRFLVSACGIIPKLSIAAECKAIAVEMIGDLMQLISSGVDPQVVCALLGVCGGLEDRVNHAPISPALPPVNDNRISPPINPSAEPICTDCKKFFNDIKTMITSNDTLAQMEQMIDQAFCSWLGPLESACKTTVHEFLPQILQILSSYYDPNLICSSLGVCGAGRPDVAKVLLGALSQKFPLDASARMGSPTTCMICKTIVTELQVLDRDKAVQDEVLGVIKTQGCARLPSQYIASCNNAVDLYGPMLFQLIATELDPASRCAALGFCDAGVQLLPIPVGPLLPLSPATPPKKQNVANGPECALCEMVIKELESMLSTNASQQQIIAALEKVCDILPDTVKVACKSFVDIYGPAIIQMVIAEMDPAQICAELGLCTAVVQSGGAVVAPLPVKPSAPRLPLKAGNAETCLLCETVIQYLEALVQNNATVEEIEAVLKKICSFLPSTMKDECDALIEQYGALIIQYVMSLESPEQICTLIGLCSSSKSAVLPSVPMSLLQPAKRVDKPSPSGGVEGEALEVKQKVPLLGENECSWGPAYWCASRENADSCNAVEHCKKHVWKQ